MVPKPIFVAPCFFIFAPLLKKMTTGGFFLNDSAKIAFYDNDGLFTFLNTIIN